MTIDLPTGWHFIEASQKRHYFHDGMSFCRRFSAVCTPHPNPPMEHPEYFNCVPCERKLKTGSTRRQKQR